MILKTFFAGVVSASFYLLFQGRGWNVARAAINGAIGYYIYLLLLDRGSLPALFLSSAFMALFAEAAARVCRAPAILFLSAALIPIVPGGGMFECALMVLEGQRYQAMVQLGNVLMEAGAIAIGIIIVSSLLQFIGRLSRSCDKLGKPENNNTE